MFLLVDPEGRHLNMTSWELVGSGYAIRSKGACVAELMYERWKQTITCAGAAPQSVSNPVQLSVNTPSAPTTSNASPPHLVVVPDSEYASRPWRKQ